MAIDQGHQPEPIGHGLQGGHIPMWVGPEGEGGLGVRQQPLEELLGRAQRQDGNRPRFPVDPAGLHDPVVGVATDFDALEAGHRLCIDRLHGPVN